MGGIYRERGPIIPGPDCVMQVWYVRNIHSDPPGIIYEPLSDYDPWPDRARATSMERTDEHD